VQETPQENRNSYCFPPQNLSGAGFLVYSVVAQSGGGSVMAKELICCFCVVLSVGFNSFSRGLCLLKSIPVREASLLEIKEDTELDPEENSTVFMGILIKGLAKLKKIPETVKAIQDRLEQELKQIVKRSTTQVADNGYQRGENLSQENQPR